MKGKNGEINSIKMNTKISTFSSLIMKRMWRQKCEKKYVMTCEKTLVLSKSKKKKTSLKRTYFCIIYSVKKWQCLFLAEKIVQFSNLAQKECKFLLKKSHFPLLLYSPFHFYRICQYLLRKNQIFCDWFREF